MVDNPLEVFVLGIACGAGIILFTLFAFWMHHKDIAQTPLRQSQTADFFGKSMILGLLMSLGCIIIAIAGALTLPDGIPSRLIWSAGVALGIVALLTFRWIWQQHQRSS